MPAVKVSSKVSVAFSLAAVFLLAVDIAAVVIVSQLNGILDATTFDSRQAGLVADAIHSWRVAPQQLADHQAQFDDLARLARTAAERNLIQSAQAGMKAGQPADKIISPLEQLGEFYRQRTNAAEQQLITIHQRVTFGLIVTMASSILIFIILTALLRNWLLLPLQILANGVTAMAEGNTGRKVSLVGGEDFVPIAKAINKMGAEVEQLRAEADRNRRLATVGEACAHVTHNVRTLLSSIRSLAQYESNAADVEPNSRVGFNYIIALVNRVDTWVRDVHSTLSPLQANRAAHHIEPLIHDILQLLEPQISEKGLKVDYQEAENLPRAMIDRALFEQAFVAVLSNAIDASPDGGRIGVLLRNDRAERVTVVIEDTGPGMSEETKQHVFEAFFTTKRDRVGLGLTTAHSILKNHGGEIEIESTPGKGTRVLLFFPAAKTNP
jgi:signal transduction histidine kinase